MGICFKEYLSGVSEIAFTRKKPSMKIFGQRITRGIYADFIVGQRAYNIPLVRNNAKKKVQLGLYQG